MRISLRQISFTFFKWDVCFGFTARHKWSHLKLHKNEIGFHLVWGKISFTVDNWTLEVHPICSQCGSSDIREHSYGDEGWTICSSCRSVEQGYEYVNLRKYEQAY
jgi:hypothetical protein